MSSGSVDEVKLSARPGLAGSPLDVNQTGAFQTFEQGVQGAALDVGEAGIGEPGRDAVTVGGAVGQDV